MRRDGSPAVLCAWLAIAILLTGCTRWERLQGPARPIEQAGWTATMPEGWVRDLYVDAQVVVTRDGPAAQRILFRVSGRQDAFPNADRSVPANVLPAELADLAIADLKVAAGLRDVELIEQAAVTLAGRHGFRVWLRVLSDDGVRFDHLMLGCADGEQIVRLHYTAPTLHLFERDRPAFEAVLESLEGP